MVETKPDISVVMSVRNEKLTIRNTIESILFQKGVTIEFIIVNDGSTDNTGQILAEYSGKYSNIRILEHPNKGLTRSLMNGCDIAVGKYIARQDAGGDISLPGRLRRQFELLEQNDEAAVVCSGARMVGPQQEYLYETTISQEELENGLNNTRLSELKGPAHHCSTMFRTSTYREVGGYREMFYVAQDLDLWMRLLEKGKIIADKEILYEARVTPTSISNIFRKKQITNTKLILKAKRYRNSGRDERVILDKLKRSKNQEPKFHILKSLREKTREAKGLYHIASCVNRNDHARARYYYRLALRKHPFYARAAIRFTLSYFYK